MDVTMRNVLKSLPAIAAILLPGLGAVAAPTIVSPADYATISTMSASLKSFKGTSAMVSYATYKSSTKDSATRVGYENDYMSNSQPVELHWSGTSGSCAVKVWRTHKDSAATPVFSTNVTGTSVIFYDPEIGRNYTWTVQNGGSTATGHFFTERNAPRIIRTGHDGFYLGNGRDEGGWMTSSGKVVKQGLVYRCREFEFYAPCNYEETEFYPIPYLRDNLGIKLDVDLRVKQVVIDQYMVGYPTAWNSAELSPIAPTVPRYHSEDDCGTSFPSYAEAITDTANRIAVWHTFAKFCDASNMPILYHCSHGKDRTGTLGYILLGVLGVSRADLNIDYGLSWYAKSSWTLSSWGIDAVYNSLNSRYSSASTLAAKCEAYLKECASDAGVSATTAQNMINAYKSLMLEDPESADVAISASASYLTYPNPKFVVAGTVAMGAGATTATLHYALNGDAEQTQALTLASGGSFSAEIPYAAAGDTLVWHVTAQNVNGGVTTAGSTASTTTSRAADSAATTYVWTGAAGDGKWTTLGNWTNTIATAYGYPASGTYATAEFPASLTGAFTCTVDQNVAVKSLYVYSPNIRLVLDDKTLTVNGNSGSYTSYSFGNVKRRPRLGEVQRPRQLRVHR